jgi:hypothetical protein
MGRTPPFKILTNINTRDIGISNPIIKASLTMRLSTNVYYFR